MYLFFPFILLFFILNIFFWRVVRVYEFLSFPVSELPSFQLSKFPSFQVEGREGGPMRGLGTDHVISGRMRGLEKKCIQWQKLTDRRTDRRHGNIAT